MKTIHFIAIGGAIMHQLALALHQQGYTITGSDDEITDPAKSNLEKAGLLPEKFGWFPEKITPPSPLESAGVTPPYPLESAGVTPPSPLESAGVTPPSPLESAGVRLPLARAGVRPDAIVLGMHARADNPELLAAKRAGIPVYSFPQYVYEVSKNKKRVVVAGSHGKTTITSMIMHILKHNGVAFDYLVGARVAGFGQSVQLTDAPLIILEGDEYPASVEEKRPKIFFYHPHISVLSGIAWDHINVFPTYGIYFSQFGQYLHGLDAGTKVFYNDEDSEVNRVIALAGG